MADEKTAKVLKRQGKSTGKVRGTLEKKIAEWRRGADRTKQRTVRKGKL